MYATFNSTLSSSHFHNYLAIFFFFVIMIGYWIPTSKWDCQSVYNSKGTSLSAFVNLPIKNRKTDSNWDEPNFSEKKSYNHYNLSHVMLHRCLVFIPLFSPSTLTGVEFWDMPLLLKWKKFILLWENALPARFLYVGPNPREWVESCYCLSKWRFD